MHGILRGLFERAYRAGFYHGIRARKQDAPAYYRMQRETAQLADQFYLEEKKFFEGRYKKPDENQPIY